MHDPDEPDTDFAAGAADADSACRVRLDALGLHTHDDLSRRIEPLVRPATRIELSPPTTPPQDAELVSHFGGLPYCEAGERWPRRSNGKPLHFVFQIFNQANLEIPDAIRLIQFYYDLDALSFDTADGGWQVRIYKKLRIDNRVCAEPPALLDITPYCDVRFTRGQSLPDWEGIDLFDPAASDLSCVLNPDSPWDCYQQAAQARVGDSEFGSQLGGYPQWIQGEDTPEADDGQPMKLLFQVDSSPQAGLMWGDAGLVYVFYDDTTGGVEFRLQCL